MKNYTTCKKELTFKFQESLLKDKGYSEKILTPFRILFEDSIGNVACIIKIEKGFKTVYHEFA